MNKWRRINMLYCFLTAAVVTGCASTQVSLETDFPSPLVEKQSTPIALIINKSLTDFVHTETVEKGGDFVIEVGSAQRALFERLEEQRHALDDHRALGAQVAQPLPVERALDPRALRVDAHRHQRRHRADHSADYFVITKRNYPAACGKPRHRACAEAQQEGDRVWEQRNSDDWSELRRVVNSTSCSLAR